MLRRYRTEKQGIAVKSTAFTANTPHAASGLRRGWLVVAALASLFFASVTHAEVVPTLYQYETLVKSQSERERTAAAAAGLAEMAVRISGVSGAADTPAVKSAIGSALRLVESFGYESTTEQIESNGTQVEATRLILRYAPAAIDRLLQSAGLPLWPANRPSILLWLVDNDPEVGLRVATEVEQADVIAAAKAAARRRGLPLTLPLLDMEDQLAVSAENLWQLDTTTLIPASERYHPDAILVGRYARQPDGQIQINWLQLHKEEQSVFDSRGADVHTAIGTGLDQAASYLAGLYAFMPQTGKAQSVVMELQGIQTFADYIKAINYISSRAMVTRADPVAVQADTLRLRLALTSDVARLRDELALGKQLTPVVSEIIDGVVGDAPAPVAQPQAPFDVTGDVAGNVTDPDRAPVVNGTGVGSATAPVAPVAAVPMAAPGTAANPLRYQWVR